MNTRPARRVLPLIGGLLLLASTLAAQAEALLDRIVAVVGDDVVMLSELRANASVLYTKLVQAQVNPMPSEEIIIKQALEQLVLKKLQLAEAERLGIAADEQTMTRAMSSVAEKNGLTLGELRAAVITDGMDFDEFRESIREQLLLGRLRNREVVERIQVTKSEVDQYLAQNPPGGREAVRLSHILIATPDGASPAQIDLARGKADGLRKRLDGGEDFHTLAQRESDGRQALEGGDLGWLEMGAVPELFATAAREAQPGDVVGPLQNASGFHLIRVVEVRGEGRRDIVRQTHARHILIRTNEVTADEDAKHQLEQLRVRILGGDDFEALARSRSNDTASAIKGGDLGWVGTGSMVPAFEEQMDQLAPDQISQPFKTQFGWHIVQVLARRDHDATQESRRNKAVQALRDRKAEEAMQQYLRRLRDEAYVEIRLDDDQG